MVVFNLCPECVNCEFLRVVFEVSENSDTFVESSSDEEVDDPLHMRVRARYIRHVCEFNSIDNVRDPNNTSDEDDSILPDSTRCNIFERTPIEIIDDNPDFYVEDNVTAENDGQDEVLLDDIIIISDDSDTDSIIIISDDEIEIEQ